MRQTYRAFRGSLEVLRGDLNGRLCTGAPTERSGGSGFRDLSACSETTLYEVE